MSRGLQLEQKLRKSEALSQEDVYHDLMAYAAEVSDQLEVYLYMQENGIGCDSTEYWLARFTAMRQRGLFTALAQLVPAVKKMPGVETDEIEAYERRLIKDMERIICMPVSGRRKASSLLLQHVKHPEKRRIGNFEMFVDEECRKNYYLSDYARHIQNQKKEFCQLELQAYNRMQSHKPPSFLAKNQQHLLELADQLFSKNGRMSLNRNSLGNDRLSARISTNRLQTFKDEDYSTPKCNQNASLNKGSNIKADTNTSRDSVEILKEIRQKGLLEIKSPKFNQKQSLSQQGGKAANNEENKAELLEVERCREHKELETSEEQDFCFSFRNCRHVVSQQKEKEKKRSVDQVQGRDNAFIAYSFRKQSNLQQNRNLDFLNKQDFELALLINEIQQEKYEKLQSKTFSSEIDSNQENKLYNSSYPLQNPQRDFLQELPMSLNKEELDSYDLEDLIRQSDECLVPEESRRELHCHSQYKNKLSPVYCFRSERKRLSNITEEASYCSESRRKHCPKK